MYTNVSIQLDIGNIRSNTKHPIHEGIIQGNPLSVSLFNTIIDTLLEEIHKHSHTYNGITLGNQIISALAYIDDIVLISTTKEGM